MSALRRSPRGIRRSVDREQVGSPPMKKLDPDRRKRLLSDLQAFFLDELDEEISEFRAEQVLDFVLASAGPELYNQAVQDARKYMQERLDDLEASVFA